MAPATVRPMELDRRDRAAAAIAAIALIVGIGVLTLWRNAPMATLAQRPDGHLVVSSVDPTSPAARDGITPGMLVVYADGIAVIQFPEYVYPVDPTPDPSTGEIHEEPIGIEPAAPEFLELPATAVERLLSAPVVTLTAIQPWDLEQGSIENGWATFDAYDERVSWTSAAVPALFMGTALWVLVGWWLASGRAGATLRRLAIPLATATAIGFLTRPLPLSQAPALAALAGIVIALGMLPLADGLADAVEDADERRLVRWAAVLCAAASALLAVALAAVFPVDSVGIAQWVLAGSIAFIPGLAAAGPIRASGFDGAGASSGRLLESTEYAIVGATPLIALATDAPPYVFPLALWFAAVLLAGRFTIRPLARLASRAALQRDLVVAATEAERARVAADIHDDALQDLTILVHRLDSAGDAEGAEIARTVSDRLRAICGDLRLPILDDLGVGPALDWLVLRIERLAGGEVRLERSDGTRPPAAVELAFFRVAQEALANAVKHGRPPIVVRYSTTAGGASLSIDDSGSGIEPDVVGAAEQPGHFGLLNMQQRAEAIGAILDVRRWPNGGTHVALEWRAT
jgi:signal transduction histidine kinase